MFNVCQEARTVAAKEYDYCLGILPRVSTDAVEDGLDANWDTRGHLMEPEIPRSLTFSLGVQFRPDHDIICLSNPAVRKVLRYSKPHELVTGKIKYLALDAELYKDKPLWLRLFVGEEGNPPLFRELDHLFVVIEGFTEFGESLIPSEGPGLEDLKKEFEEDFREHHLSPPRLTLINRGALPGKDTRKWGLVLHQAGYFGDQRRRNGLPRHQRSTKEVFAAGYDPAATLQEDRFLSARGLTTIWSRF